MALAQDASHPAFMLEAVIGNALLVVSQGTGKGFHNSVLCAGEMEALQDAIGTGSVDQAEMLGRLIRRVADLEAAVAVSARERRELHNQLVELRGNVRLPALSIPGLHCSAIDMITLRPECMSMSCP